MHGSLDPTFNWSVDGEFIITENDNFFLGYRDFLQIDISTSPFTINYDFNWHDDVRALICHTDALGNDFIYCGNDGGIDMFDVSTSTETNISSGLQIGQIFRIANSKEEIDNYYIGLQDNGTDQKEGSNSWIDLRHGDGGTTYVDDNNVAIYYTNSLELGRINRNTKANLNMITFSDFLNNYEDYNFRRVLKQNPEFSDRIYFVRKKIKRQWESEIIESKDAGATLHPQHPNLQAVIHWPDNFELKR
jgi:hypothetical protein